MTKTYLIRLRPLDFYFFGGERTFGGNDGRVNYLAETRPYPQQTSLLGVLRYLFTVLGNGCDIGEHGFLLDTIDNNPFGDIHRISPLFLTRDRENEPREYFRFGPLGNGAARGKPFDLMATQGAMRVYPSERTSFEPVGYSEKDDYEQRLFRTSDGQSLEFGKVFKTFTRVGITKQGRENDDQDGFYKIKAGRLAPDFSFAYTAQLEATKTDQQFAGKTFVVSFGGEKAQFAMSVDPVDDPWEPPYASNHFAHQYPEELHCTLLTSDALITSDDWLQQFAFVISGIRNFRFIHTPKGVSNFAQMRTHQSWKELQQKSKEKKVTAPVALHKSSRFRLLRAGTLLYHRKKTLPPGLSHENLTRIGYNHFQTIKRQI